MKKVVLFVSAVTLALGLAACSTQSEKKVAPAVSAKEVKTALVKFYMGLSKKINAKDADLNTYESADTPTPEMKAPASASAAAVAEEVKAYAIPAELKKQKVDLQEVLKDFADSYQAKADELKKDKPSLDAANATFAQGEQKLGKIFVDAKMLQPSFSKEVN
ncbi:MAG: hypothetical protein Q8906_03315 [Bacillota bacterium]|nr:hypothetical protein [Bacillota bacterium]